jgi:hypothetical protein
LVMRQWELETITPGNWVADKCLMDYLIYAGGLKEEVFKEVIKRVVENNTRYNFIFYLPIEFSMEHDGKRSDDEEFQKMIDVLYKAYLERHEMTYVVVSGAPEEKVEQAVRYINQK